MSLEQTDLSIRPLLKLRAEFFKKVRSFFFDRGVLEVDTPILVSYPPNDANIDIMEVKTKLGPRFLTSSPEYLMKRLLAKGSGDIFQLSHVYRDGEFGRYHSPFFSMLEWYRIDFTIEDLLSEVLDLLEFLGIFGSQFRGSYRKRFIDATGIDPLETDRLKLIEKLRNHHHRPEDLDFEELIDAVFITFVEPTMVNGIHIIDRFLPHQAALAKIENREALRFEIYVDGVEVANGYEELANPIAISQRFTEWNKKRAAPLEVDPRFLSALNNLPATSGVAVGADRLFMLASKAPNLSAILPFNFEES
jgi:lysyl-tRNA synthetase class 2